MDSWGNGCFLTSGEYGTVLLAPADTLAARCEPKAEEEVPKEEDPENPEVPGTPEPEEPDSDPLSPYWLYGGIGLAALLILGAGIIIARNKGKAKPQ